MIGFIITLFIYLFIVSEQDVYQKYDHSDALYIHGGHPDVRRID